MLLIQINIIQFFLRSSLWRFPELELGAGKWKLLSQRRALRQDVFPFPLPREGWPRFFPGSGAVLWCIDIVVSGLAWEIARAVGFCGFAGVVFAFAMQECGLIMRPSAAAGGFKFERHLSWRFHYVFRIWLGRAFHISYLWVNFLKKCQKSRASYTSHLYVVF